MLGKKRNGTVFGAKTEDKGRALKAPENAAGALAEVVKPPTKPAALLAAPTAEKAAKPQAAIDTPAKPLGETSGKRALFFKPSDESQSFADILSRVQTHIAEHYATVLTDYPYQDAKIQLKRYIEKYLFDEKLSLADTAQAELVDMLYSEMAEYGFLTRYIFGGGVEEININSWRDIEVQYTDGRYQKLTEQFDSPAHAINVIRRMLHVSGMILDNARPAVIGHLSKNIRIAALKTPLVDEDIGIAASIRIVNPQKLTKADFTAHGSATDEMLTLLTQLVRYGISICISGATSSGKTTLLGWLLTTIPSDKRIYTIENGSREMDLVREQEGKVVNAVVHTLTRESEDDKQSIDQTALLDMALRFNPDIIVVGEMRGPEANAAQEAARTGVSVLTTIHANSSEATYRRMVSLCKRAVNMTDETLMQFVTEAYPIIVYCKQLENKARRLMEIMECEITADGRRVFHSLYQYHITENRIDQDGRFIMSGHHVKCGAISAHLAKRLLENGMPLDTIACLKTMEEV